MKLKREVEERVKKIVDEYELDCHSIKSLNGYVDITIILEYGSLVLEYNIIDRILKLRVTDPDERFNFTRDKELLQLIENILKDKESWE